MRKHKQRTVYHSILPVLRETGCPFCRLLKEFQAERLQSRAEMHLHQLCNFHVWGLAAVQDAPDAARIFLSLLDEAAPLSGHGADCGVCREIAAEEDLRIREFVSCLQCAAVTEWLKNGWGLCVPHGMKLRPLLPPTVAPQIDSLMEHSRRQLCLELEHLRDVWDSEHNRTGWGAVGRAAEFLVAHRGLRA